MSQRNNPFFVGIDGGNVSTQELSDLFQKYKLIFLACTKNNVTLSDNAQKKLFAYSCQITQLKEICDSITLVPADILLLRNINIRNKANIVDGKILSMLFDDKFDTNEIVVFLPEISERKCLLYAKINTKDDSINHIHDAIGVMTLYGKSSGYADKKIISLIDGIDDGGFWVDLTNTKININEVFPKRRMVYSTVNKSSTAPHNQQSLVLNRLAKGLNNADYTTDISDVKPERANLYMALKLSKKRTFYASHTDTQTITNANISSVFDTINDHAQFQFLNKLLISKDYCHLVVNNRELLCKIGGIIEKYKPLYVNLWGYAWITMYMEESIFATKSTTNNRFVFEIDTANKLPVFPFTMSNIKLNPYITLLLDDKLVNPQMNCMSINALEDCNKYYGMCTKTEAFKRINIFATGTSNIDAFAGIDPTIFAISGSIIPACLQKLNPLFEMCITNDMSEDEKWDTYFSHFYGDSDIDVMCATNFTFDFFRHATNFLHTMAKNLRANISDIHIEPVKSTCFVITKHFVDACIDDVNNELGTKYTKSELIEKLDKIVNNQESGKEKMIDIAQYFYRDYVDEKILKLKRCNENTFDDKIEKRIIDIYSTTTPIDEVTFKSATYDIAKNDMIRKDNEIYYFINDFKSIKVPENKNFLVFKFSESIKIKIHSPKLQRSLELFKINSGDPFNTVAKFHLPCVRGYIQGNNIWMLPSCISAMMSMINIDYKYFAGSKNPIDIINKYRMRGFGVVLNQSEKSEMLYYNKNAHTFGGMFDAANENALFGPKSLNNNIYKPRTFTHNIPANTIYHTDTHKYIGDEFGLSEIYNFPKNGTPIGLSELTSIQKDGNIRPLRMWIADFIRDQVGATKK